MDIGDEERISILSMSLFLISKGVIDPKAYLNRQLQCEQIFQTNELIDQSKFTHAIVQFERTGRNTKEHIKEGMVMLTF